MSLTADTADAIVAVDKALAAFDHELGYLLRLRGEDYREYTDLKNAIEALQAVACGEGMHFDSLDEARAYRNVTDHMFTSTDRYSCAFMYGEHRCDKMPSAHTLLLPGYYRCADCCRPIRSGGFGGVRCADCMDPYGSM